MSIIGNKEEVRGKTREELYEEIVELGVQANAVVNKIKESLRQPSTASEKDWKELRRRLPRQRQTELDRVRRNSQVGPDQAVLNQVIRVIELYQKLAGTLREDNSILREHLSTVVNALVNIQSQQAEAAVGVARLAKRVRDVVSCDEANDIGVPTEGAVAKVSQESGPAEPHTAPSSGHSDISVDVLSPLAPSAQRGVMATQGRYTPYPVPAFETFIEAQFGKRKSAAVMRDFARVAFYKDFEGDLDHDTLSLEDMEKAGEAVKEYRRTTVSQSTPTGSAAI